MNKVEGYNFCINCKHLIKYQALLTKYYCSVNYNYDSVTGGKIYKGCYIANKDCQCPIYEEERNLS